MFPHQDFIFLLRRFRYPKPNIPDSKSYNILKEANKVFNCANFQEQRFIAHIIEDYTWRCRKLDRDCAEGIIPRPDDKKWYKKFLLRNVRDAVQQYLGVTLKEI